MNYYEDTVLPDSGPGIAVELPLGLPLTVTPPRPAVARPSPPAPQRPTAVRAVRRTLLLGSLGCIEPMQVAETTSPVDEAVAAVPPLYALTQAGGCRFKFVAVNLSEVEGSASAVAQSSARPASPPGRGWLWWQSFKTKQGPPQRTASGAGARA